MKQTVDAPFPQGMEGTEIMAHSPASARMCNGVSVLGRSFPELGPVVRRVLIPLGPVLPLTP